MASLHYKFATMNSGKSTQLIQAHFNYLERGMHPLAMTPAIDDRFGVGVISARVGLELKVDVFSDSCDLFEMVKARHAKKHIDVFIVDEAQFLTREQVYQLARIVDEQDIPVMAYGLKTDFRGELFPGSYHLLCLADKFEELKSICWCGNKAHMNSRVNEAGQVMRDGEKNRWRSVATIAMCHSVANTISKVGLTSKSAAIFESSSRAPIWRPFYFPQLLSLWFSRSRYPPAQ